MATVNIWAGTSSFVANQMTPFALYDSDSTFQSDTTKVADWCARRLGYPIIDVELQSGSFFACFEEAVSEYGAQVNFMNIKNNLFQLKGQPSSSAVNQRDIKPSLNRIVELSEQYGVEAGVGGNVELKQGSITVSSGSTSFNTSSDYRLKENVSDLTGATERLKQLQPKKFSWIDDKLDAADTEGFLAHEVQEIVPKSVAGDKDEMKEDKEGNTVPRYQSIDYSKLVPLLTASLQEAIAKIETLETKVAALEAE